MQLIEKNEMTMCTIFLCHKQPSDFVYCGYYICKHMREKGRYTTDLKLVSGYSLLGIDAYVYIVRASNTCLIFLWIQ